MRRLSYTAATALAFGTLFSVTAFAQQPAFPLVQHSLAAQAKRKGVSGHHANHVREHIERSRKEVKMMGVIDVV